MKRFSQNVPLSMHIPEDSQQGWRISCQEVYQNHEPDTNNKQEENQKHQQHKRENKGFKSLFLEEIQNSLRQTVLCASFGTDPAALNTTYKGGKEGST